MVFSLRSLVVDSAAELFLLRLPGFVFEHSILCTRRTLPFLPSDLLDARTFGLNESALVALDFVKQKTTGEKTIERLRTFRLATHAQTGGPMKKHHGRRGLVHV